MQSTRSHSRDMSVSMIFINVFGFVYLPLGEALKYDKNFKGPLSKRSCTDVLCLLLFVAFLVSWGFIGQYGKFFQLPQRTTLHSLANMFFFYFHSWNAALKNGDLDRLLVPTDSMGRKCGVDNEVLHKPYLLFFNLENCIDPKTPISGCPTPQVCVEQCPRESFVYRNGDCSSGNFEQIKTKLICSMDIDRVAIQSCTQIDELVQKEKCARWYLPSQSCKFRLPLT